MSEQLFNASLGLDLASFITTDFAIFIPINTYIT